MTSSNITRPNKVLRRKTNGKVQQFNQLDRTDDTVTKNTNVFRKSVQSRNALMRTT